MPHLTSKFLASGLPGVILCLITSWISLSLRKMQTLHEAAAEGDEQRVANLLASSDVDLDANDSDGFTALMHACRQGHTAVVKELLKAGASISQGTAELSPLLCAAEGGRKEVIRLLLDYGAELEERNLHGVNALICATSRGNVDAAHYLLLRGPNVHTTNKFGWTPLMLAAIKNSLNHVAVIEVLLRGGARTEDRSPEGLTALMYAAELGSVQGMDRLLRYDADPLASGRDNKTVVDYASTEEKRELLQRKTNAAPVSVGRWPS
jgi:ankyrin repeat protein